MIEARFIFHDDTTVDVHGVGVVKHPNLPHVSCEITSENVVRVVNTGNPVPLGLNVTKWPAQPVYIKSVLARSTTLRPEMMNDPVTGQCFNGPRKLPNTNDIWILIDKDDPKVSTPIYPLSSEYHLLDGSDTFMIRFVDDLNPYSSINDSALYCLQLLNLDMDLLLKPRMARLLGLYKIDGTSLDINSTNRNIGWWLNPYAYNKRWGDYPALSSLLSHYGFLSTWATSDGLTCEHYDHPLYLIINYLLNGDVFDIEMALYMLRKKICYGLYNINNPVSIPSDEKHPYRGAWKWEKGERLGTYMPPSSSKEWDTSLIIAYKLTGEKIFKDAVDLRAEALLTRTNYRVWPRAGGGREAGRYLQNLFVFFKAGIRAPEMKSKAESFINYFFSSLKPNEKWIPNDYATTYTDAWEGMTFFYFALKWMTEQGVAPTHTNRLYEMLEWYCVYGLTYRNESKGITQAHYHVNIDGTPTNPSENTTSHMSFWYKLAPFIESRFGIKYRDKIINMKKTITDYIGYSFQEIDANKPPLDPAKIQFDSSNGASLGPSGEKQWPMFLEMAVRL